VGCKVQIKGADCPTVKDEDLVETDAKAWAFSASAPFLGASVRKDFGGLPLVRRDLL
jgi:hypothetical protein